MLHILNKSPADADQLPHCTQFLADGDAVLLIENGVYTTVSNTSMKGLLNAADISVYALAADLQARGLGIEKKPCNDYQIIDYAGFVRLVVTHPQLQSW